MTGLFQSDRDIDQLCADVRDAWHQQTQQSLPEIEVTLVEDKDWERAWMDDFQPLKFGERLWIVPSWHDAPDPEAANLMLDPGLAFGTGTHPTTALCLEWLDGQDMQGKQVIDYGCGSGILGLAALLLGADHVIGVDTDPQALEASRENARRNGVEEARLDLYLPEDEPDTRCDVMLANILAQPLIGLAPHLAALTRRGGDLPGPCHRMPDQRRGPEDLRAQPGQGQALSRARRQRHPRRLPPVQRLHRTAVLRFARGQAHYLGR